MPDKKTLLGIAIGVGCTLVAPLAVSTCASAARPLAKSILKRSLFGVNVLLEKIAVAAESVTDLLAEVRAEVHEELVRKGPPARARADGGAAETEIEANGPADASREEVHS